MSSTHRPIIDAFLNGRNKKISNTESRDNALFLFGNKIAWIDLENNLWIQDCGWVSATTQDRLNMLPNIWVSRSKGQWYLSPTGIPIYENKKNYIPWDGKPKNIGKIN